eukprot:CAMPEP_0206187408 /NCGR_PEP_ID=MMETSP0166-20121206/2981_1 /ASSEMBLY_ACC=CAM_ASM_000260 /TAXON_ID=95228 /ORGANISM="Vannella robusta, Strain DIVA3 518/3/11/1/6" /LENGTH=199 /DNA_ID=CAMNT_0053602979 /DNA_START=38 /DNA_END=633 /DNA_ORIENTATION=-
MYKGPTESVLESTVAQNLEMLIENGIPECEFEMLEEEFQTPQHSRQVAKGLINKKKNRYGNILPYDATRVVLTSKECVDGSDYINANFVGNTREYIASQAPLVNTMEDFWRMVAQYNISVLVMLTREYESTKLKAHRYWPDKGTEHYGDYAVTLLMAETYDDFIVRSFLITSPNGDETRTTQYQFLTWPDHSVPDSPGP